MRATRIRNLTDARRFAAAYDEVCGVLADPSWILDARARLLEHAGQPVAGYVLDPRIPLAPGLLPEGAPPLPQGARELAAFWVRPGLPEADRRRVRRRLQREVRGLGLPVVSVMVCPAMAEELAAVFPQPVYEGASASGEVPWLQVRTLEQPGGAVPWSVGALWDRAVALFRPSLRAELG